MKESFWLTLKNYWHKGMETGWTLLVPLIMILVFILVSVLINLVRGNSKNTTIIKSLSSLYYSGIFTIALTLFASLWLMQFTTFFGVYFCQLGFLIGLLVVSIISIVTFTIICTLGKEKNINALGISTTSVEDQAKFQRFKTSILVLWLWSLFLVVPFVILLIPNTSKHLISIVLDNSGSMNDNLKQCTDAMEIALLPTRKYADYVFTTIDYTKDNKIIEKSVELALEKIRQKNVQSYDLANKIFVNQYYDDLINQKLSHKLATNTSVYNDVLTLFNSFSQMGIAESGSPVYEGIWQNYLESRRLAQGVDYESKKMIVITDGLDNMYKWLVQNDNSGEYKLLKKDIFQQRGKLEMTASEFYNSICTINYGEYGDNLLFKDCESSIVETYDGTDVQSYFDAFRSFLPEMFFDIFFLYILIGIVTFLSIILLIIKNSK
jgi:hypothetical protein